MSTYLPPIIVRADASAKIGTGHVMRCLALAQAARLNGRDIRLVGRISVPWLRERIARENIPFHEIVSELPVEESVNDLIVQLGDYKGWIVLDGYHFSHKCQKAIRSRGNKLLIIDDYNHQLEYSCDILLNQNLGAEKFEYRGDVGKKLFGTKYALLRQEFVVARTRSEGRRFLRPLNNILITLGGGDFIGDLERIAMNLDVPELSRASLRIVAGTMSRDRIVNALKNCPAHLEVLMDVEDMPKLMQSCDICITAGGSTCWELCCLGLPFLTVQLTDNQRDIVRCLMAAGITTLFNRVSFREILANHELRNSMASAGRKIVDALGCKRVEGMLT